MQIKYFNALLQLVINDQLNLFYEIPDREALLRNTFEEGFFIPPGVIDDNFGWGIGNTKYIQENDSWLFGFLHKTVDAVNISTIPLDAISLDEAKQLQENLLNKTPFFFNFNTQKIYTQNHWRICRKSTSASYIWYKILSHILQRHVNYINVQSIPEVSGFWEKFSGLAKLNKAEFDLFGPNILNEKRIRDLLSDFNHTGTRGLIITLKNYIDGLKIDAEEIMELLKYVLRGGGKASFQGLDKSTNKSKTIFTEEKHQVIYVSNQLSEASTNEEISRTLQEIIRIEGESKWI